jgi:hypothetical protein
MKALRLERTADSAEALPIGLARQTRAREKSLLKLRRLRKEARDEIRRLIDFLDQSDPYVMTELEDCHDGAEPDQDGEPSLGWTTSGVMGGLTDLELDDCDREDDDPDEPKQQPPVMFLVEG